MGRSIQISKKKATGALTGAEKKQLVDNMTKNVMEEMTGPDSFLRMEEAEVAEELKGKSRGEQNEILDGFAETLEKDYPFVGEWKASLKPSTYIDGDGNEVKGRIVLDRKTLGKNVRELVEASVDNLLVRVNEMGEDAAKGVTSKTSKDGLRLGVDESGAEEFNASIVNALVENLPQKLEGTVKVEGIKNKDDEYTGNVQLSWVGQMGSKDVKISLFTGKPVGSTKKA